MSECGRDDVAPGTLSTDIGVEEQHVDINENGIGDINSPAHAVLHFDVELLGSEDSTGPISREELSGERPSVHCPDMVHRGDPR